MPTYRQTRAYARARNSVAERGRREFDRLARAVDLSAPDALDRLQAIAHAVMLTYGAASAELGARWFDECSPRDAAPAELSTSAAKRRLHEGVAYEWGRFAADEIGSRELVDGCTAKAKEAVLSAASETLFQSTAHDARSRGGEVRYTRVASGDSCAFCALLAAEDRTFDSEDTAAFDAHDGCMCVAVPYHGADDVSGYDRSDYENMYEKARDTVRGKDMPEELQRRIADARRQREARGKRWTTTHSVLVTMRYQNGLEH